MRVVASVMDFGGGTTGKVEVRIDSGHLKRINVDSDQDFAW